jgi:hypothetical protein
MIPGKEGGSRLGLECTGSCDSRLRGIVTTMVSRRTFCG